MTMSAPTIDLAPVGSPLRTIDELVESLDTGEIEKAYDLDSPQGRNPFHPKTFIIEAVPKLAVCVFGFVLPKNTGTLFEKMRNLSLRHCVQPQLDV